MKFINAAKFYKVDVLILSGDLTGKMIVPIIRQADGTYTCNFLGIPRKISKEEELLALERDIRFTGFYPYHTTPEEKAMLDADKAKRDDLFTKLMLDGIKRWISIAEEKLKGSSVKCYIMPGNDDVMEIDEAFGDSSVVINPDCKVVWIDDSHEMISSGCSNITPWRAPRDIPEEELNKKIDAMASKVQKMENCIFNFHCPPWGEEIDLAPLVDENFRYIGKVGQGVTVDHVGSKAVRQAIEKYQPLLGLHGHIHESRGVCKIGRTVCINPGSEYSEGILRGAIIELKEKGKLSYQLTSG